MTYLGPTGSQVGKKESIKDTARVLGRMYDGIEYRGFAQRIVHTLAEYSGVPVWNGLTNEFHPTQALADTVSYTHLGFPCMLLNSASPIGTARSPLIRISATAPPVPVATAAIVSFRSLVICRCRVFGRSAVAYPAGYSGA